MNSNYQVISDIITDVLPENWERVCLYGEVQEDIYEFIFYVYENGHYIQCYDDKYPFDKEVLFKHFRVLHEMLKTKDDIVNCLNFTFVLMQEGEFNIDFEYETYNDIVVHRNAWKEKYLT